MRVFREPCYFAEAVYLLYFFVNQISYEEEYSRISRNYYKRVKEDDEDEARILRRVRELNRVLSVVTAGLDRGDARLRYYFKAMQLPSFKNSCCLAQIMLVTVPLDCSDVEEFAGRLESGQDDAVFLAVNAHWEAHRQELPCPPAGWAWHLVLHTACPEAFAPDTPIDGRGLELGARSAAVLVLRPQ